MKFAHRSRGRGAANYGELLLAIDAIQTGTVKIKTAQVEGRGTDIPTVNGRLYRRKLD